MLGCIYKVITEIGVYLFIFLLQNWSPTSEIVWTCGRKVLQCVDSRDDFYKCLDDISVKMRRRALQGYGLKVLFYLLNAQFKKK